MRIFAAAAVLTVLGSLAACSTDPGTNAVDPSASDEPAASTGPAGAPTPVPEGEVRTQGLVMVLDDGDGPELCLGPVAESYPPQCGGPALVDFDWGDVGSEQASGVRWGSYALTGTYDGTTFTVTDAIPAALYDVMAEPEPEPLAAACDDATTTDTSRATPEDMDATLAAASALPTYATAWLTGNTINVAVTGDPEAAEAELRRTWGGMLCVTTVERTDADLNEVNTELQGALGDQLLTSGSFAPDSLDAQVVFDDGSIQAWADETYGEGLVRISSALVPVS
ncbi:hypothetical protein GCM10011376_28410 [Nocardioides flavus (ex Wang et al. 2016)]|uniref:LppP/LprE lipoprotein n=1 Tax=Nocardioides flavus (ex Wang et al. 2016) TaxID=2058780 RepID=A0ABQ3HLW3_9ACTN|nr:hypothetical protein [Nocardioides flavus (ex Wang et al. 2016)]GHE18231.1 hypothetical protein GCM10011376_28410 [Nocardioides flavus (ex Wang et al. 2016)]